MLSREREKQYAVEKQGREEKDGLPAQVKRNIVSGKFEGGKNLTGMSEVTDIDCWKGGKVYNDDLLESVG